MIMWKSERVSAGTESYTAAKREAQEMAKVYRGRVEWQDEYNDYSVRGVFVVRS